jgi:type VI secretion system protein ImpM
MMNGMTGMNGMNGGGATGAYGKIPSVADFVSVGASHTTHAFGQWLEGENDQLSTKRRQMPPLPIRFVYRDPEAQGALVGVLAPSRDQVGRSFPLSVFTHVDAAWAALHFPALPAAYAPFLDGAVALLGESHALSREALHTRLDQLPLPSPPAVEEARTWSRQALEATPGGTILQALFGPLEHGVHFHGINMFRTACARVGGQDPGAASTILECPAVDDVQLDFWLTFAFAVLRWTAAPPSFAWTDIGSPDHRLLISLGAPAGGVLSFLADPNATADRLWPMRTQSATSIEAGRRALSPVQLQALEPPAPTAAALLAALAS